LTPFSADLSSRYHRHGIDALKIALSIFVFVLCAPVLLELSGCHHLPPSKPLSELTPQERAGRQVFLDQCARCHYPDSESGLRGPGLLGLFRQPDLPSGVAANDQRVTEVILRGRGIMPAFHDRISDRQLEDLMAYLHTL
jgi:cytochrome c553